MNCSSWCHQLGKCDAGYTYDVCDCVFCLHYISCTHDWVYFTFAKHIPCRRIWQDRATIFATWCENYRNLLLWVASDLTHSVRQLSHVVLDGLRGRNRLEHVCADRKFSCLLDWSDTCQSFLWRKIKDAREVRLEVSDSCWCRRFACEWYRPQFFATRQPSWIKHSWVHDWGCSRSFRKSVDIYICLQIIEKLPRTAINACLTSYKMGHQTGLMSVKLPRAALPH